MANRLHTGGPLTAGCQSMKTDTTWETPAALRAVTLYTDVPGIDSLTVHELVALVQFVH